jgi:hypothetical protein
MGEFAKALELYSRANTPEPVFGIKTNEWDSNGWGISLDIDDPWTVGGLNWILVAPAAAGRQVHQVWRGQPLNLNPTPTTRVLGTENTTHIAATYSYGYAVLGGTRLVRWDLNDISDTYLILNVVSVFNFTTAIVHMDSGLDENVFLVDAIGAVYSFGNNLAADGTIGLLCDPFFGGANRTLPARLSSISAPVRSICVNGETVFAQSTDGSTLYACGRNPWTGPGASSPDLTSWVYWRKVNLPLGQQVKAFSCGHFGGAAIVENSVQKQALSWGINSNRESGTGDTSPIVWNPTSLVTANLGTRYLADISLGWQFGAVATRTYSYDSILSFRI